MQTAIKTLEQSMLCYERVRSLRENLTGSLNCARVVNFKLELQIVRQW